MHWKRTGEARGAVHWMRLLAAVLSVIAAATVVRATATGRPAPREAQFARITAFFDNEVATRKIPGAVVLLQQHGRPVYLKTFGVRDIATKLPMTPETLFALHSMTKPITSVAAMMLVDRARCHSTIPSRNTSRPSLMYRLASKPKTRMAGRCSSGLCRTVRRP